MMKWLVNLYSRRKVFQLFLIIWNHFRLFHIISSFTILIPRVHCCGISTLRWHKCGTFWRFICYFCINCIKFYGQNISSDRNVQNGAGRERAIDKTMITATIGAVLSVLRASTPGSGDRYRLEGPCTSTPLDLGSIGAQFRNLWTQIDYIRIL